MTDRDRLLAWTGVFVPLWTLGTIVLATVLSPGFSWADNALSNLGAATTVATPLTRLLFNGGLLTGGLVGLGFALALYRARQHVIERIGAVVYALAVLAMAGVGLFPQGEPLHVPMAVGFYLLFTLSMCVYGAGNVVAEARTRGVATVVLGLAHLGAWIVWAQFAAGLLPGLAVPEFVGAVIFGGWTVATARWQLVSERALGRQNS